MATHRNSPHRDPEPAFEHPRQVAEDRTLSDARKIEILTNWELDLVELLRATEENMADVGRTPGEAAELLRQVKQALEMLARRHGRG